MLSKASPESTNEENICRICMDIASRQNALIHPCRCKGTMKYVHEECLKTWLLSQYDSLDSCKCELCKTELLMEIKIRSKCTVDKLSSNGLGNCLLMPLLLAVLSILIVIVYLLIIGHIEKNEDDKGHSVALIVTCCVSAVVILGLIVNDIRELCFSSKIIKWKILSQEFFHDYEERPCEESEFSVVMVLPQTVTFKGRVVETPDVNPPLQPVRRGDSTIAFAPLVSAYWSLQYSMKNDPSISRKKDCFISIPLNPSDD